MFVSVCCVGFGGECASVDGGDDAAFDMSPFSFALVPLPVVLANLRDEPSLVVALADHHQRELGRVVNEVRRERAISVEAEHLRAQH